MEAEKVDYYQVLQVDPIADSVTIYTAFRRLARLYHPDLNRSPDASRLMQQLNIAYGVLKDPIRRRQYDLETGHRRVRGKRYAQAMPSVISLTWVTIIACFLSLIALLTLSSFRQRNPTAVEIESTATGMALYLKSAVERTIVARSAVHLSKADLSIADQVPNELLILDGPILVEGISLAAETPAALRQATLPTPHSAPLYTENSLTFSGIATQNAGLYRVPDINLASEASVFANSPVQIVSVTSDKKWYRLDNGYWIESLYVIGYDAAALQATSPNAEPTVTLVSESFPRTAIANRNVNLYKTPGDETTIEAGVFVGTTVILIGSNSDKSWYQLNDNYWLPASAVAD